MFAAHPLSRLSHPQASVQTSPWFQPPAGGGQQLDRCAATSAKQNLVSPNLARPRRAAIHTHLARNRGREEKSTGDDGWDYQPRFKQRNESVSPAEQPVQVVHRAVRSSAGSAGPHVLPREPELLVLAVDRDRVRVHEVVRAAAWARAVINLNATTHPHHAKLSKHCAQTARENDPIALVYCNRRSPTRASHSAVEGPASPPAC